MEWFPYPLPAYTRHWTMFICCGWAHGSIIMPLPTHVSTQADVGSPLKFSITTGWQRMTLWSGWGWLLPKMEWIPHPLPTYERYLTTFIFCGWAHGTFIMWLPLHVFAQMWEVQWNPASLLGYKGYHCAVVEALTQDGRNPTCPPSIW
jgi:hypothetical protein